MDAREIRTLSDDALRNAIEDQKEAMYNLRFQAATGQLEDTNIQRNTRRLVARLKTILREREIAAQQQESK